MARSKESAFGSNIRQIDASLEIGFFEDGHETADDAVRITKSSRNSGITKRHTEQVFIHGLKTNQDITVLDGTARLDGSAYVVADKSKVGWIGDALSDANGEFHPEQVIEIEFFTPRRFPRFHLKGNKTSKRDENGNLLANDEFDNHYPTDFTIKIYDETGNELWQRVVNVRNGLPVEFDGSDNQFSFTVDAGFKFTPWISRQAKKIEVVIRAWSLPKVLPRITYLSGTMHSCFDGDTLQSVEILEEKTANISELSYGLSANYCKASFLHKDKMFFNNQDNFALLARNRSVSPFIKCGNSKVSLGKFFSEEWQLDVSSPFMSVKAYDVLYGLQELEINYGLHLDENGSVEDRGILIRPCRGITLAQVVGNVFKLIDEARESAEMFNELRYDLEGLSLLNDVELPYILPEKKSAWDVLADIANLACAYIYSDRDGYVVIEQDEFTLSLETTSEYESEVRTPPQSYNKVEVTVSFRGDVDSIRDNGLREYDYDATMFVTADTRNTPKILEDMARNILAKYGNGRAFVDTEWSGDPSLLLKDRFLAQSQFENEPKKYEVISNEINIDGSFTQITKGRAVVENSQEQVYESENKLSELVEINQNNAFSFGIPVKSRTIVNQVNVSYYVLEPDRESDGETVEISWRDCNFIGRSESFTAVVDLEKVYDEINKIDVEGVKDEEAISVRIVRVLETTVSSLTIEFTTANVDFDEINVKINGG